MIIADTGKTDTARKARGVRTHTPRVAITCSRSHLADKGPETES